MSVSTNARDTPAGLSDETLVERIRTGDRAAFDLVYQRYFKRVFAFVDKRLRNAADTEETVQEVFINVFASIDSYRGEAPFAAWVFGLTRRTIAGRFKKKRHPTVPLEDDEQETSGATAAATDPSPLEAYECQETFERLEDLVRSKLSPEQRQLFELHHLQDRPISEIAERTSKSENAVKSHLYRTRKILLSR